MFGVVSYAVEKTKIKMKLPAVCFREKYKNKTETKTKQKQKQNKNKKITPALDRTGVCLLKVSDNLYFFKIEDSLSVSNNQCLKYFCRQCVSSEDIIFTVHIGYDCL